MDGSEVTQWVQPVGVTAILGTFAFWAKGIIQRLVETAITDGAQQRELREKLIAMTEREVIQAIGDMEGAVGSLRGEIQGLRGELQALKEENGRLRHAVELATARRP